MPEAVIVAAARSPIGRAFKGSLKDLRPDDLAATIIRAALDKVPQLDPTDIDDLMLGCGLPGGEQGFNMGRVVAVLLGHGPPARAPRSPATARRRCRPPGWRCTRSRRARATCSSRPAWRWCPASSRATPTRCPDTHNPHVRRRRGPVGQDRRERRRRLDTTRARTATSPTSTSRWARPPRTWPGSRASPARTWTSSASARQNLAEKAIANGFWAREITPVTLPDGTVVSADDGPRAGVTSRRVSSSSRCSGPTAGSRRATAARSTTAPPRWWSCATRRPRELGITPLARIVSTGVTGLSPEIMGFGPVEASQAGAGPRRA